MDRFYNHEGPRRTTPSNRARGPWRGGGGGQDGGRYGGNGGYQQPFGKGRSNGSYRQPFGRGRGGSLERGGDRMRFGPTPPKQKFYCCSCERDFGSEVELEEHKSEHIICGLDGCQFEAHALVVTKHIKMQHTGGLYERMKNVKTPEEIAAWREERKKYFPTLDRITEKRKEAQERRKAGIKGVEPVKPRVFRYKITSQASDPDLSFVEMEKRLRKIEYHQSDNWRSLKVPAGDGSGGFVPISSKNKSPIVCLENFYLNVKLGSDGKLVKENKVTWKGFKVKKLDRLTDSESEGDDMDIPISDDEDENGGEKQTEMRVEPEVSRDSSMPSKDLLGSLVNYSSASDSENEDVSREKETKSNSGDDVSKSKNEHPVNSPVVQSFVNAESNSDSDSDMSIIVEEFTDKPTVKRTSIAMSYSGGRCKTKPRRPKLLEMLLQDEICKEKNLKLQASSAASRNIGNSTLKRKDSVPLTVTNSDTLSQVIIPQPEDNVNCDQDITEESIHE